MTTLQALADRAQNRLSDAGASAWAQATIEEWVTESVRVYSRYFPRVRSGTIAMSTGVKEYTLPDDFISILSVQYPATSEPPYYLLRRHYTDSVFWNGDYYDIVDRADGVDASELWIGVSPSTGEFIEIQYSAHHAIPDDPTDHLTVLPHHEDLLLQYVYYLAMGELTADESTSPTSNSSLIMAQLDQISGASWRRGEAMFKSALDKTPSPSRSIRWAMDKYEERGGIY